MLNNYLKSLKKKTMKNKETLEEDCPCTDECLGYLTKTCKEIETLEEVAERLYPTDYGIKSKDIINIIKQDTFINGAKWQQERSYSEEEVIDLLYKRSIYQDHFESDAEVREWFEKFKKK